MRKISKKSKEVRTTIENIPNEVLSEIFARVASSSFTDVVNAKLSCKLFQKIAEDTHVYQHVSLDKFPLVSWEPLSEKQQSFLTKCRECNNPELMYKQAVKSYFIDKETDRSAYKCLERAVNLGHLDAMYVTCIVLLLSGDDESIKAGIKMLGRMKKSRHLRSKVRFCREKLIINLSSAWVNNQDLRLPVCCTQQNNHKAERKINNWSEENIQCEACCADNEIREISDYISVH